MKREIFLFFSFLPFFFLDDMDAAHLGCIVFALCLLASCSAPHCPCRPNRPPESVVPGEEGCFPCGRFQNRLSHPLKRHSRCPKCLQTIYFSERGRLQFWAWRRRLALSRNRRTQPLLTTACVCCIWLFVTYILIFVFLNINMYLRCQFIEKKMFCLCLQKMPVCPANDCCG